ncbi:MAG: Ni/Fe hydrogenase subunit alpha [Caldilineaceae bacterium]|nr:Ni/Fe hydrogenase subunit alpha [Caldilineaceae bacterium]
MTKTITIDPVTRIEGHAKITLYLDDDGQVADARFHVTEFRGFEKFCEGRSFWEMPGITARICGICPVSHLMASAKAGDAILGVNIPPTAAKLRRLMNWAQLVQSHALSFFHLSGPDLLLGMDSDPAKRNVMGLIEKYPDVARNGIRLRRFGQKLIEMLGGRSVHPSWTVPGGVRDPLSDEDRSKIRRMLPEALDITGLALDMLKDGFANFRDEEAMYGNFPSLYMGLVTPEGGLEHYDGMLRVVDSDGNVLEPGLAPARYREILGEAVEPWSYLKFPFYKPAARRAANGGSNALDHYAAGMYRVGPLARVNVCDFAGTPRADAELREFRRLAPRGRPVANSFHYHYARLIEILYALERIAETVDDPAITDKRIRAHAEVNNLVGVGVSEAPRGTLFHEYHVNGDGILQQVNLIIATGQNNLAMNRTVKQIAQYHITGGKVSEGMLNRIEHGIRLYDPCLSCSTHAVGQMPMVVEVYAASGEMMERVVRN